MRPHPRQVLDGVVGRAEAAVRHPGALGAEDDVEAAVGDVGLDLLGRAPTDERTGRADEGDEPGIGEPGADADHVLLGDPDVDEPVRKLLGEAAEVARADRVVADGHDPGVLASEGAQLVGEGVAAVERLGARGPDGGRTGRGRGCHRGGHRTAPSLVGACPAAGRLSSASACVTWSGDGTL